MMENMHRNIFTENETFPYSNSVNFKSRARVQLSCIIPSDFVQIYFFRGAFT